jgi:hypothetical protein
MESIDAGELSAQKQKEREQIAHLNALTKRLQQDFDKMKNCSVFKDATLGDNVAQAKRSDFSDASAKKRGRSQTSEEARRVSPQSSFKGEGAEVVAAGGNAGEEEEEEEANDWWEEVVKGTPFHFTH